MDFNKLKDAIANYQIEVNTLKPYIIPNYFNTTSPELESVYESMAKERREKKERELKLIELKQKEVELLEKKVGININNSTVQQNFDNATGVINVYNNDGINAEDFATLLGEIKQIFSSLPEEDKQEGLELVDAFSDEVAKEQPKKAVVKTFGASIVELLKRPIIALEGGIIFAEKSNTLIEKLELLIHKFIS